ncbi:unnamed protein product [marine sediment metagenome]|uniref:Uncharacterized protein n=1 Tax=marine sediment metagenome TaxID=412755 RepID=X1QJ86_9ZZZZ
MSNENHSTVVSVRLASSLAQLVDAQARAEGLSRSDYLAKIIRQNVGNKAIEAPSKRSPWPWPLDLVLGPFQSDPGA